MQTAEVQKPTRPNWRTSNDLRGGEAALLRYKIGQPAGQIEGIGHVKCVGRSGAEF